MPVADPEPGAAEALQERLHKDRALIGRTLPRLFHGVAAAVLGTHAIATGLLAWIVFTEVFPHPAMYLLMGILLWLLVAIRYTAWMAHRRISAFLLLVASVGLHVFWTAVLGDQVPARPVVTGRVVARPDLPVLYVPIALYALAMAGLVGQAVAALRPSGRRPGPGRPDPRD